MAEHFLFVDAQNKRKGMIKLTAFGKTFEEVLRYYQNWIKDNKLQESDMWYANVFECETNRHLGYVTVDNEDFCVTMHAVDNSHLDPFHRSLKQYFKLWFDL